MTSSVVTERACIGLANQLILEFQLPVPRIQHMSEIASATFVCLFQALCGYLPNGVMEFPQTKEDEVKNIQVIIDTLALTFLHLPLTHIKGRNVIEMEPVSVYNLLEIFQAFAKHASMSQRSETSSSPATTSPTTADEQYQRSQFETGSSADAPSWSSVLSEDASSQSSTAAKALPQETAKNGKSYPDKRLCSPPCADRTQVVDDRQPMRKYTQSTWANKLRGKSCNMHDCSCRRPVDDIGRRCDRKHPTYQESPSSSCDTTLCERCKQSLRKLKHDVKSPFKKMRVSPRREEKCRKHYCSNCIDLDSKIDINAQQPDSYLTASHTEHGTINKAKKSPSRHYCTCANCKSRGKENYVCCRFSDMTAPVCSYLHDSSLCANCKLALVKHVKPKCQYSGEPATSPRRSSVSHRVERIDDTGNYSILHQCPKAKHSPVAKMYASETTQVRERNFVEDSETGLFSYTSPSQESTEGKWSSHKIKKNWSYPVARTATAHSPTENSFSSSSPDLHVDKNPYSGQLHHSTNRNRKMQSPDFDSVQETDDGPIRLRFHGSSKQVHFGDPRGYLGTSKKSKRSVIIPIRDVSPRVVCDGKYQRNEGEVNVASTQTFLSNVKQPTKRVVPKGRRQPSKSPRPRETLVVHHHTRNVIPPCRSQRRERERRLSNVDDYACATSFPFAWSGTRQRAGNSLPLAWQDGVVKCAATYGFRIPDSASTDAENESLDRTAIGEANTNLRALQKGSEQDLLERLQQEFPYLAVPTSSIESLRNRYLQDMKRMANLYLNGYAGKVASLESYNLLKRQLNLQNMMNRDLAAVQRKNDLQMQQYQWRKVQSMGRDQRMQSVHIKHYIEDHHVAERSKMLRKRTREEMLFKQLYEEGMQALQDKLRDMKKHVKDDLLHFRNEHQGKLEAIHNYYKNELELLTETVASQKHHLEDQEMTLKRLQREFRQKLRDCLKVAQEEILRRDEEDFHFREQDKDHVKEFFKNS